MRKIVVSLAFVIAAAVPALAASVTELDDQTIPGNDRYGRCLEMVKRDAPTALDAAQAWFALKGGAAALHCEALALVQLHRLPEAAAKLDEAAHDPSLKTAAERAALYDQAGNAWMLANRPDKAVASLSAALVLNPSDEDLLTDRARARAQAKDWQGADADLSAILSIDPNRADIYVLRASARHAEGRKFDANADIARALSVYPDYPEALVERGVMKFESGDQAGARADWQMVVSEAPDSDAAAAARTHLSEYAPANH